MSHDERLISMVSDNTRPTLTSNIFLFDFSFQVCKELWVCANGTVTSLEGGIEEYKRLVLKELADAAAK